MRTFCSLVLIWFMAHQLLDAQSLEPGFAQHLIQNGYYQETIDLTDLGLNGLDGLKKDSLQFYRAWAYFNLQQVPESIAGFQQVGIGSAFYEQSVLFGAWGQLYLRQADASEMTLKQLTTLDLAVKSLHQVQTSAQLLLQKKPEQALALIQEAKATDHLYQSQLTALKSYGEILVDFKPKSRAAAGALSAVIPGLGKVYAGEKGSGISSFLLLAGLGGMAAENIIKSGPLSWNGLLFTGLFSVFYLGNIYGSIISIQKYRSRFYEDSDQAIVATALIPLRDFYR